MCCIVCRCGGCGCDRSLLCCGGSVFLVATLVPGVFVFWPIVVVEDVDSDAEPSLLVSRGVGAWSGAAFRGGLGVADEMDDSEFVDLRALGARSALHAVPVRSHDAHMHFSIPNSTSDAIRMEGGIRHAPQ